MAKADESTLLMKKMEEMQAELQALRNQVNPPPFLPEQRYSRSDVQAWLDAKPAPYQFFSAKAGTMVMLHPDRVGDRSAQGLPAEQLPSLMLEFSPWDSYGSEFPDPEHEDGRTVRLGVICLHHLPGITITEEDIVLYEFPETVTPMTGIFWQGKPFYTVPKVIEMIDAKRESYARRPEFRELLMTGEQFRNRLRPMYEARWAVEDVNKRNQERAGALADDAWKRGAKPAIPIFEEAGV